MFNFLRSIRFASRSPKWQSVRKQHLEDYPKCIICGRSKKLEVHHIKPVHLFPELELERTNLVTLCADPCHFVFGHLFDFKSWNKDLIDDSEKYSSKIKFRPYK